MARSLDPIVVPESDSHAVAWAAGFFDGEGCVRTTSGCSYETSQGTKRRKYLRLDVSQKTAPLLEQLVDTFGVGNIYFQKERSGSSEGYRWVCNGRVAFHVINLLWPWIGEQKKADFKRSIKAIRETRNDFIRHPQRGRLVRVAERG